MDSLLDAQQVAFVLFIMFLSFFFFFEIEFHSSCPAWSVMAQFQLEATSAPQVQEVVVPQTPE